MTNTSLMRRLSDANPAPHNARTSADKLFAQIVSEPGDPRLTTAGLPKGRRPLVTSRRSVHTIAISSVAVAGATAAVLVGAGAFNSPSAVSTPSITVAGAHAEEVAYVVKRVRAQLVADDGGAFVTESSVPDRDAGLGIRPDGRLAVDRSSDRRPVCPQHDQRSDDGRSHLHLLVGHAPDGRPLGRAGS